MRHSQVYALLWDIQCFNNKNYQVLNCKNLILHILTCGTICKLTLQTDSEYRKYDSTIS